MNYPIKLIISREKNESVVLFKEQMCGCRVIMLTENEQFHQAGAQSSFKKCQH